jgi:hypothetical protein
MEKFTSASSFFNLSADKVQEVISMLKEEREKHAWVGDTRLSRASTMYLIKNAAEKHQNKGSLTELKKVLVSNLTLAEVCKRFSDVPRTTVTGPLNNHSIGTTFEALINISEQINGKEFINGRLWELFSLVGTNFLSQDTEDNFLGTVSSMSPKVCDEDIEDNPALKEYFVALSKALPPILPIPLNRVPCKEVMRTMHEDRKADATYIQENVVVNGVSEMDHFGQKIKVSWRSKKKNWYVSEFYSCCGCDTNSLGLTYQRKCPRSKWLRSDCMHPGKLKGITSGKQGGGVGPRCTSADHIPVCGYATWSCCWEKSTAEGCESLSKMPLPAAVSPTSTSTSDLSLQPNNLTEWLDLAEQTETAGKRPAPNGSIQELEGQPANKRSMIQVVDDFFM